jgi:dipeptidyl aminopeptidase/acylaminoacyl peptidase
MEQAFPRSPMTRLLPPNFCATAAAVAILLMRCAPTVSADAMVSRIAYSSFQGSSYPQIWLVNPDGTNPKRITQHPAGGDGAGISPDGTQIVYESPRNGWANLFLINTDGTGEHRLLATNFYGQSASWSPDGTLLAFTHSSTNGGAGGTGTTWVAQRNGSGLTQLSPSSTDDWMPCWSPDGTQIAFQSKVDGVWQIFVMNADGSGREQITTGSGDKYAPRWAPNGLWFAYTLFPDPAVSASSIHVARIDGLCDFAVTDTASVNGRPSWSPDGSEIAFHSNRYGNFRVFRVDANGTDTRQVTLGSAAPGDWGGDWRKVVVPAAGVGDRDREIPFRLDVPTPARPRSVVRLSVDRTALADLVIYDVAGRRVRTLLSGVLVSGWHEAPWDGRDDSGGRVPAGVYFCRMQSGSFSLVEKLVYLN